MSEITGKTETICMDCIVMWFSQHVLFIPWLVAIRTGASGLWILVEIEEDLVNYLESHSDPLILA